MKKKVLVAGFFDLLHSGHIRFLEEASQHGDVYVSLGSDENSIETKRKSPIFSEEERKYMLESLKYVKEVRISYGEVGSDSYLSYLNDINPDIFITNEDGSDLVSKKEVCEKNSIRFIELKRVPPKNFVPRSSTDLATIDHIPHRLDLVGFYDQLMLNSVFPGSVILVNLYTMKLDERSGMSSSTRKVIRNVFGNNLPDHLSSEEIAKIIFAIENPPGYKYISGVVDQLGLCLPGINRLKFDNSHWPYKIDTITRKDTCDWLQSSIFLKQTQPRPVGYNVLDGNEKFPKEFVHKQSELGENCWEAINSMNTKELGRIINEVHDSQKAMIPAYEAKEIEPLIAKYKKDHLGVKLMGAGGYGYMMIVTDKPEKDFIGVSVRAGINSCD